METFLGLNPAWWVLIGFIVMPIVVFGSIHMNTNGTFIRWKEKIKSLFGRK